MALFYIFWKQNLLRSGCSSDLAPPLGLRCFSTSTCSMSSLEWTQKCECSAKCGSELCLICSGEAQTHVWACAATSGDRAHLRMERRSCSSAFLFAAGVQDNVSMEMVDNPQACGGEDSWQWWDGRKAYRTTEQLEEEADGKRIAETEGEEKETKNAQKRARARREGQRASADVGRTQAATSGIISTGKKE